MWLALTGPAIADTSQLRIAVLKFGTVNWLMETIKQRGLDTANGFELVTVPLAGKAATSIAFQAGDVDMIVNDWVWAMRKQADGIDMRFTPYSRALGALISNGQVDKICDLKGQPVGVVGGELDKSWLILQALATRDCGIDLAIETQALFGAPPLMSRQLEDGAVSAVSTFWPFVARLKAKGMTEVIAISDALQQIGITPAPPMVGFVWDEDRTAPDLVAGFLKAQAEASVILADDDTIWDDLRPLMRAKDDETFNALRDAFRAGITARWSDQDTQAAKKLYGILTTQGGADFKATAGQFTDAIFAAPAPKGG